MGSDARFAADSPEVWYGSDPRGYSMVALSVHDPKSVRCGKVEKAIALLDAVRSGR